uniref:Uncharacterized protein n=1 Tax=Anguilla anguilla TaxID=7936 RepID=A0A0E9RJP2_ANGAN
MKLNFRFFSHMTACFTGTDTYLALMLKRQQQTKLQNVKLHN